MNTSTAIPWIPVDPQTCNYYIKNNTVTPFTFANPYGGIPQNLTFNAIGFFFLIILFTILRRAAGNYGRLALIRKDESSSKWTQIFFAPDTPYNSYNNMDPGIFSWIRSIFTLSDEQIKNKCGKDAIQYLNFQRHLILFVFLITIVCICIILPINFHGDLQGTTLDFGHTTISNLADDDPRLWVHVLFTILLLPLGVYIMRRFSVTLQIGREDKSTTSVSRTLMFACVPRSHCNEENLYSYFNENYPQCEIEEITIARNVKKLTKIAEKLDCANKAKVYCESILAKNEECRLSMAPFPCGILCSCFCKSNNALEFYTEETRKLVEAHTLELEKVKCIGITFVTFANVRSAEKIRNDLRRYLYGPLGLKKKDQTHSSFLANKLKPWKWHVRFAPSPDDIIWENLDYHSHRFFLFKAFLINLLLFLLLFFFTSPAYILSELELIFNMKTVVDTFHLPDKINDFLPTLMLWTLAALLPIIVAYTDLLMGHWRRSSQNLWIMRKVFFYLLFMVLLLPSMGLMSLRAFFEVVISQNTSSNHIKWECIFLPDNGAFFVNYVITSALMGTGLELIRFPELIMYTFRMMMSRSVAETPYIRKAHLYEFPFGFNYGWMLIIFALVSTYSVICPLITPFGLFYMVLKHGVDRYNLYYAYKSSKISKHIHTTAVNFVIVSLLLQQLLLLFFNSLRSLHSFFFSKRAICSITMLVIYSFFYLLSLVCQMFKGISPIQYSSSSSSSDCPLSSELSESIEEASSINSPSSNNPFVPNVLFRRDQILGGERGIGSINNTYESVGHYSLPTSERGVTS